MGAWRFRTTLNLRWCTPLSVPLCQNPIAGLPCADLPSCSLYLLVKCVPFRATYLSQEKIANSIEVPANCPLRSVEIYGLCPRQILTVTAREQESIKAPSQSCRAWNESAVSGFQAARTNLLMRLGLECFAGISAPLPAHRPILLLKWPKQATN